MWRAQGYAWEITTPEGGWGLDCVLQSRQHVLNGITNGIDMQVQVSVLPMNGQSLTPRARACVRLRADCGVLKCLTVL